MHRNQCLRGICFAITCLTMGGMASQPARADVRLPGVFSSHMVLQRERPITVWGWAGPAEKVSVQLAEATSNTQANERGEWKTTLPAMEAKGPLTLTVTG